MSIMQIETNEDIIREQQQEAKEILEKLRKLYPEVILGGGAPRNWLLGLPAKDYDFYMKSPKGFELNLDNVRKISNELTFTAGLGQFTPVRFVDAMARSQYNCDPELDLVIENTYTFSVPIQIMLENVNDIRSVVEKFGISVSQVYWNGEEFYQTRICRESMEDKVLVETGEQYFARDCYRTKIKSYFPDWPYFSTREDYYNAKVNFLVGRIMGKC